MILSFRTLFMSKNNHCFLKHQLIVLRYVIFVLLIFTGGMYRGHWGHCTSWWGSPINTLRLRHHGRHFADDTFKRMFLNENVRISIKISLKFVPKGPMINVSALVQIMAWRRPGDKPLSEPMMVSLLTHICITLPQWIKTNTTDMRALMPEACI